MIQKLIQTSENNQINPVATKQIKEIIKRKRMIIHMGTKRQGRIRKKVIVNLMSLCVGI